MSLLTSSVFNIKIQHKSINYLVCVARSGTICLKNVKNPYGGVLLLGKLQASAWRAYRKSGTQGPKVGLGTQDLWVGP